MEPTICSSYRTRDKQEELFEKKLDTLLQQGYSPEEAEREAARWVARPGTSEHETALAVDIVDAAYQILDQQQEQTPVQQWLMTHCAEYGFILRYPTDKSDLTGIGYEPWHYRYVGTEAAETDHRTASMPGGVFEGCPDLTVSLAEPPDTKGMLLGYVERRHSAAAPAGCSSARDVWAVSKKNCRPRNS